MSSVMSDGQLRPLVALRWRMVRSQRARRGFLALASVVPALLVAAVLVGVLSPRERSLDVLILAPTAYASVALLAVLAPLVAGGGNELFPQEQLSAYPVTARTQYLASLALTPLNLAWTTQLIGLVGFTAYFTPRSWWMPLSLGLCLLYVALVTVVGHALAWLVVGVRQHPAGRRGTWWLAAVLCAGAAALVSFGDVGGLLDSLPTTYVVVAALNSSAGPSAEYLLVVGILLVLTAAAFVGGARSSSWALRQPGESTGQIATRPVPRRAQPTDERRALLATDRASVWRSTSLRRGLLVLGVLPGLLAAAAGLEWPSLVLLPGLVAAGAGLLFGVNVFCLDGSGAVWLSTLPGRAGAVFWSKVQVVAETCVVAVAITVAAGALRSGRLPTTGELGALGACAVVAGLRVVATCMELSVERPHRADLRGPRDTPAPPGVMAAYSARLAVSTTLIAVLFSGLAEVADWEWSVVLAVPFVLLSIRRLLGTARRWQDVAVRSRVVTTVASG
jgi:hypothetical protein